MTYQYSWKDLLASPNGSTIWGTVIGFVQAVLIRNTLGFIQGGATLTIVPLISLGADQTAKLQALSDCNQLPVQLYHLDEYRARDANRSLCRLINELN